MKTNCLSILAIVSISISGFALAGPKTYQVTGPVLAVTPDTITVQKGDDKWELARDSKTKVTGELKVGEKVTIEYTMAAVSVDVKADDAKPATPAKKKKSK